MPSEFGVDVARHSAVEPVGSSFEQKLKIRTEIEAHGIPYTYLVTFGFAGYFFPSFAQPKATEVSFNLWTCIYIY